MVNNMHSSAATTGQHTDEIWEFQLLCKIEQIVFPWPTDEPLDGNEIGRVFFLDPNAYASWDKPPIKTTLRNLSAAFLEDNNIDELMKAAIPADIKDWKHLMSAILLLTMIHPSIALRTPARFTTAIRPRASLMVHILPFPAPN